MEELVPCMGRPGLRLLALRGARVDTLTQPGLEDVDGGRHSSGDAGGEGTDPSTCSISPQSAGDAGEAAFIFFLDLVASDSI